jgi:hypothetical protein
MGENRIYRTSDLSLAAYLLSSGLKIRDVDRSNGRRCGFVFVDREKPMR